MRSFAYWVCCNHQYTAILWVRAWASYLLSVDEILEVLFYCSGCLFPKQCHGLIMTEFDPTILVREHLNTQLRITICQPCTILLNHGLVSDSAQIFAELLLPVEKISAVIGLTIDDPPPRGQNIGCLLAALVQATHDIKTLIFLEQFDGSVPAVHAIINKCVEFSTNRPRSCWSWVTLSVQNQ